MALTILSQPSDVLIPSQNNCGNLCFSLSSDIYVNVDGIDAVLVYDMSALPLDSQFIELEGVRLTFRTAGSTLGLGEVYIPATVDEAAQIIADYFDVGLDEIQGVKTAGPQITFTRSAAYMAGNGDTGIRRLETIGGLSVASLVQGAPHQVIPNYEVLYEVRIVGETKPLYRGQTVPQVVPNTTTGALDISIDVDVSGLPINYTGLNNDPNEAYPNLAAQMVVRFAERVGETGGLWISSNTISLLHSSCKCSQVDFTEYEPGTSDKKFLYIPGDDDARELCKGDNFVLWSFSEAGTYAPQVNGVTPGIFVGITNPKRGGIRYDFGPYVLAEGGTFDVGLVGLDNSDEVGPLEFSRIRSGSNCCNLSQIMFLNCLGGWQYFGITTIRSATINVATTNYISCPTCGGANKARTAAKSTGVVETYYTRPLKASKANLDLLEAFFNATAYYDLDGNQIQVTAEEIALESLTQRIQVPFTVSRVEDNYGLIDHWYNSQ